MQSTPSKASLTPIPDGAACTVIGLGCTDLLLQGRIKTQLLRRDGLGLCRGPELLRNASVNPRPGKTTQHHHKLTRAHVEARRVPVLCP